MMTRLSLPRPSVLLLGVALLAGCADDIKPPLSPDVPAGSATLIAAANTSAEKAALNELTYAVALSLQDAGLRQRVKNDLRNSRHTTEHKLEFRRYLNGASGGILLAKMAKETGRTREQVLALLNQVRPLEFYMPVARHRASWSGDDHLWVASYLEDDGSEFPAVLDLSGSPVPLWPHYEDPPVPTLVLVPVETNFDEAINAAVFTNGDDQGGTTIGTYYVEPIEPCEQPYSGGEASVECGGGGGGGGGSPTYTPGLWMTFAYGNEGVPDGLWGLKGEPEIEMHVFGASAADPSKASSLSCSHAGAYGSYRFDMNDHTWSGNVLIFSQQQIDSYYARTTDDFAIQMWEDDDGVCQIKTDKNLSGLMKIIYDTWNSNAVKTSNGSTSINYGKLLKVLWDNASWLKSNDDFVGNARRPAAGEHWPHADATHKLQRSEHDNNGRIRLIVR